MVVVVAIVAHGDTVVGIAAADEIEKVVAAVVVELVVAAIAATGFVVTVVVVVIVGKTGTFAEDNPTLDHGPEDDYGQIAPVVDFYLLCNASPSTCFSSCFSLSEVDVITAVVLEAPAGVTRYRVSSLMRFVAPARGLSYHA